MVARAIVEEEPRLVPKLILTGIGPAGGVGIDKVTPITLLDTLKATLTFKDPKEYLFFTRTANGKATARQFVNRLKELTDNRDKPISATAFRNQLKAIHTWGRQQPLRAAMKVTPCGSSAVSWPSSACRSVAAGMILVACTEPLTEICSAP